MYSNGGGVSAPICSAVGSGIAHRGGETPFYRYLACGAMPALRAVPSRFSFKSCNDFTILAMITLHSGLEMWMREINVNLVHTKCFFQILLPHFLICCGNFLHSNHFWGAMLSLWACQSRFSFKLFKSGLVSRITTKKNSG